MCQRTDGSVCLNAINEDSVRLKPLLDSGKSIIPLHPACCRVYASRCKCVEEMPYFSGTLSARELLLYKATGLRLLVSVGLYLAMWAVF